MASKTVNTVMSERVRSGRKMKTSVSIQEFRDTDAAYAIVMSPQQILDLAHQLITDINVMEPSRLILTVHKKYPKSMSITEY